MDREEIVSRVNKVVLEEFDVDEGDLNPDAHLGDDLDLDSLDGIDLVVALEREFRDSKMKIKEKEARELMHLRDVYDFIEAHTNGTA